MASITLTFIDPTGKEHKVEAVPGQSVMRAAKAAMVPGIEAVCGGNCICATCHCYVEDARLSTLPEPDDTEAAMLEVTPEPRPESRLTCQIPVTEALDGMVLRVPASQH
jgi:2Fe-2S ferredoxin